MAKDKKNKKDGVSDLDSIEKLVSKIQKEYGKTSIRKMGDKSIVTVEAISTGSILLDEALGINGLPRGRIVEIFGPEGSGKCLIGSTYCLTPKGLFTIAEIFTNKDINPSCTSKETPCTAQLINREGSIENTTHFTNNNKRKVFKVITKSGNVINGTENHPVLVMSKLGNWVWKHIGKLTSDDYICTLRSLRRDFGKISIDLDAAYFLGICIADGNLTENRISITNNDDSIISFLRNTAKDILGISAKEYRVNNSIDFHFNGKEAITAFYAKYGLNTALSKNKKLTENIRSFTFVSFKALLQGYMDCECYIDKTKAEIEVTSASYDLLFQLKLILQQVFNITAQLSEKKVKDYPKNEYWKLNITGDDCRKYVQIIGTRSSIRQAQMEKLLQIKSNANIDTIPYLGLLLRDLYNASETTRTQNKLLYDYTELALESDSGPKSHVTYDRLHKIIEEPMWKDHYLIGRLKEIEQANYYYDQVVSSTEQASEATFDFAMEKTNSFIANSIISHNTTLALHCIAEAQKLKGGAALFVDAEHAFSPDLANKLNVDVPSMLLCQPDSGEQGLDVLEMGIASGKLAIAVVDSVSALVPQAEIDGEMGDHHMGLQARLMGQAMRKINGSISKTNTLVIFINQLRQKIGVMFGNPETTSGGNALKFYSSIRLDIRRIGSIKGKSKKKDKDGKHLAKIIGNKVRVKIIKNKLAPPFKVIETDLIFGHGFNKEGEILDLGYNLDIIEMNGPWYSYRKDKLGQGKPAACKALRDNPSLFESIIADIHIAQVDQ